MSIQLTRRGLIRGIVFFTALCLTLGVLAWSGYAAADRYRTGLENTYQRALDELSDHVANIEVTLNKAYYANTSPMLIGTANKLFSESNQAKNNLSALPISTEQLEQVNHFISQVGDYSLSLSTKAAKGQDITAGDRKKLKSLGNYAKTVGMEFEKIDADYSAGGYAIGEVRRGLENNTLKTKAEPVFGDNFMKMSEGFTDYPTLIYDGPFSDHLLTQKSYMTSGLKKKSQSDLKKAAATFLGVSADQIEMQEEVRGLLPLWNYAWGDNITVSVTQEGGLPNEMVNARAIGEEKVDRALASRYAKEFLEKQGLKDLKESYYLTRSGVCTINFAFVNQDVICYSDLVKVGVALDNGEVVSFSATGYLMNHRNRDVGAFTLTEEKARESVSPTLTIRKSRKAMIPTGGGNEVLCYEFTCTGENNETVLVYIDGKTGLEEQIQILMETEGGILAM